MIQWTKKRIYLIVGLFILAFSIKLELPGGGAAAAEERVAPRSWAEQLAELFKWQLTQGLLPGTHVGPPVNDPMVTPTPTPPPTPETPPKNLRRR